MKYNNVYLPLQFPLKCQHILRYRKKKKLISSVQDTTRKEAIGPPQKYQNQNDPVPKLLLRYMERSRDPLVPGGNTTRYQRLDIGTRWCYHPVLMDRIH